MGLEQGEPTESDIWASLELLRKIRGSIRDSLVDRKEADFPQKALNDAQAVGEAAADALVNKLTHPLPGVIAKIWPKYASSEPFSTHQRAETRVVDKILKIPYFIQRQWRTNCCSLLRDMNELPGLLPEELLNGELGIYSPLSSDYLTLAVYRDCLSRYVSSEVFQLKPAYTSGPTISGDLALLPTDKNGQLPFQSCSKIGSLLDTAGLNTKPKLDRAILLAHPNQTAFSVR